MAASSSTVSTIKKGVDELRAIFIRHANKTTAKAQEKYFKNVINFHGLKSPQLKEIFKEYYKNTLSELETNEKIKIAYALFDTKYGEEKQIGILTLNKVVKSLNGKHLKDFENIFDKHVYDWGTCDSFSTKVITNIIRSDSKVAQNLIEWKDSPNLWRQRSACVSFVLLAKHGQFNEIIKEICESCVKNPERFVQLGVGWVLRELSLADLDLVIAFVKTNFQHISREGLRYTIEKMDSKLQKELLDFHKNANSEMADSSKSGKGKKKVKDE